MSISPVISLASLGDAAASQEPLNRQHPSQPAPDHAQRASSPDAGNVSKQEAQVLNDSSSHSQLPEDEVELQRDSALENEIIVRYVDGAGNLILQVPSGEMLSVQLGIMQELQQAQAHASSLAVDAIHEGESHGH